VPETISPASNSATSLSRHDQEQQEQKAWAGDRRLSECPIQITERHYAESALSASHGTEGAFARR
jgi:hypothetical protein